MSLTSMVNNKGAKEDIPVLPKLPLQDERNLATRLPHNALQREPEPEPEPSLPSASAASLSLASLSLAAMKPLNWLPLEPLLLE